MRETVILSSFFRGVRDPFRCVLCRHATKPCASSCESTSGKELRSRGAGSSALAFLMKRSSRTPWRMRDLGTAPPGILSAPASVQRR